MSECPCGAKLTHTDYLGERYDGSRAYTIPEHKRLYTCHSCGRCVHAYNGYDAAREMAHDDRVRAPRRDGAPGDSGDE
jgi:hypothetical protein